MYTYFNRALMPSPTRTMTPAHDSLVQPKRKLESTVSTENASGGVKKREKAIVDLKADTTKKTIPEAMETESDNTPSPQDPVEKIMETKVEKKECVDQLKTEEQKEILSMTHVEDKKIKLTDKKSVAQNKICDSAKKAPVKKEVKSKTIEVVAAISSAVPPSQELAEVKIAERKTSLPDDSTKPTERRRSRILETAEKFQSMNNQNNDKYRKFTIPGVSVGNFKKEFERKASLTQSERKPLEKRSDSLEQPSTRKNSSSSEPESITSQLPGKAERGRSVSSQVEEELNHSDSKSSIQSFSLEDARRSMENSIALLNQAKHESSKEVDQLCAQTENMVVFEESDRQRKLRAAQIIGNAIPHGRLGTTVRKPPMPFGINGRSISGSVVQQSTMKTIPLKGQNSADSIEPRSNIAGRYSSPDHHARVFDRETVVPEKVLTNEVSPLSQETKTSRAEITLKSATLPRRKPNKSDVVTVDIPIQVILIVQY